MKTLAVAFALIAAPALAAEPQVGRWATDLQHCSGSSAPRAAPLIVAPTTLTWATEFCTVGKMYKAARALYIEGRCSNGGATTRRAITLAMKGERLAVTWGGEQTEMKRCP